MTCGDEDKIAGSHEKEDEDDGERRIVGIPTCRKIREAELM